MEETPAGQTAVREEKTERSKARDWPACKKWTTTLILSGFAFLQPLAETMLAPISGDLGGLGIAYAYEWVLVKFAKFGWRWIITVAPDPTLALDFAAVFYPF